MRAPRFIGAPFDCPEFGSRTDLLNKMGIVIPTLLRPFVPLVYSVGWVVRGRCVGPLPGHPRDIQQGIKVFLGFIFLTYLGGRVMKAFTVITIIALILLVGGGVTAGLIVASEQSPSEPAPQAAIPLAEPPQAAPSAETVRPMQSSVVVQQSGGDTPDSDQGRGLTAKPAASGDGDGQLAIPEKAELKYPNLGSTLDQMAATVEEGEVSAKAAAKDAPVSQEESVAVTIYLSGNVDEVVSFLEDNGGSPRNVGRRLHRSLRAGDAAGADLGATRRPPGAGNHPAPAGPERLASHRPIRSVTRSRRRHIKPHNSGGLGDESPNVPR